MTAEFAIVLPAILLVVAASVAAVGLAGDAIRLADAAGVAARAAGRGDDALLGAAVAQLAPGASVDVARGDLVCVRLSETRDLGPLTGVVPLSSRSCAASEGG